MSLRQIVSVVAMTLAGIVPALAAPFPTPNYSGFPATPFADKTFFPIAVWWQQPQSTRCGGFANCAAAAAATHINMFHGVADGILGYPEKCTATAASDDGEYAASAAQGVYVVTGIGTNWSANGMGVARSVACAQAAIAATRMSTKFWLGVNIGDEPSCTYNAGVSNGPTISQTPAAVSYTQALVPGRIVLQNMTDWELGSLSWYHCTGFPAALQAPFAAEFDLYPLTNAYVPPSNTDYNTVNNDSLWRQGVSMQQEARYARPGQPLWTVVEDGSDVLGSGQNNAMSASVTGTILDATGPQRFGSSWLGLKVTGLGLTNSTISSIIDNKHAVLSASGSGSGRVMITGGVNNSDCVAAVNLCVVNGNEYRAKPAEVAAEAWMSIINGASGIGWFCHDTLTGSFCLGDSVNGGPAATATQQNLAWIDQTILAFAPVLNAPTVALCNMISFDEVALTYSATSSCTSGRLTLKTSDSSVPASAIVKQYGDQYFVIVQSAKKARTSTGVTLTMSLDGAQGGTVAFDSNARYDAAASNQGSTASMSAGTWSDTFGAAGNHYQTRIYRVSGAF